MPKQREKLRKITAIPFETKVIDETEDAGIVENFFAVLGNIDHDRDRLMSGAFTKTISEQGVGGIRVLDSHNFSSATDALGSPLKIEEVGRNELPADVQERFPDATGGMRAETRFNLKTTKGNDTFQLLKAGDLKEWSFGFSIVKADSETVKALNDRRGWTLADDGQEIRVQNIREVELFEYSPVIWGANSATSTGDAKGKKDDGFDIELHKKLTEKHEKREPVSKSTNLGALIRSISIAFYNQFPDTSENVYWVLEVWDTHLIVEDENADGSKFWKVNYHLDQDQLPVFAHNGEWSEIEQVWVDKSAGEGDDQTKEEKEGADQEKPVAVVALPDLSEPIDEIKKVADKAQAGLDSLLSGMNQEIGASLQQALMAVATTQLDDWLKEGNITPDQFVVLSAAVGKTIGTMAISIPHSVKEIAVPASIVTASKAGPVIVTRKTHNLLDELDQEAEPKPKDAEPSDKQTLTSKDKDAYASIQEMKRNFNMRN